MSVATVSTVRPRMAEITYDVVSIDGEIFLAFDGMFYTPCTRCGGEGNYPSPLYSGICLLCDGYGTTKSRYVGNVDDASKLAAKRIKLREAKRVKAEREAAKRAAEWQEYIATVPAEVISFLDGKSVLVDGAFIGEMCERLRQRMTLTPNMVAAIERIIAQRAAKDVANAASTHVGTVGSQLSITVTVESTREIESTFGYRTTYSTLLVMKDEAGNSIKCFTNSQKVIDALAPGTTHTVTATVKEHSEYNGAKQTLVTRIALAKS